MSETPQNMLFCPRRLIHNHNEISKTFNKWVLNNKLCDPSTIRCKVYNWQAEICIAVSLRRHFSLSLPLRPLVLWLTRHVDSEAKASVSISAYRWERFSPLSHTFETPQGQLKNNQSCHLNAYQPQAENPPQALAHSLTCSLAEDPK